jgi:predicted metal-binding protein
MEAQHAVARRYLPSRAATAACEDALGGEGLTQSAVTISVCVTCRNESDAEDRPGAALLEALREKLAGQDRRAVRAESVECLAVCNRPCTIALAGDDKWTYVIGDLDKDADLDDLIASARAFAATENGIVPWKERPDCFKKGVVSRTPPIRPSSSKE